MAQVNDSAVVKDEIRYRVWGSSSGGRLGIS